MRKDPQLGFLVRAEMFGADAGGAEDVRAVVFAILDPAAVAGERDAVALVRTVGVEGVVEQRAVAVAHENVHRILDVDIVAKDVSVAHVAGFLFRPEVERFFHRGVLQHRVRVVVGEGIAGDRMAVIARVSGERGVAARHGILPAVEQQPAVRDDLCGNAVDPPVHEIEVMRRLVHEQPAGIAFLRMPAAEIVGAVAGVEQILHRHLANAPNGARGQDFADLRRTGRPAIVERDAHGAACLVHGAEDRRALFRGGRHGLFRDHIAAGAQRLDDVAIVFAVDRANHHRVRPRFPQHPTEIGRAINGHFGITELRAQAFAMIGRAHQARVAEADDLGVGRELQWHGIEEHAHASAGADVGEARGRTDRSRRRGRGWNGGRVGDHERRERAPPLKGRRREHGET